MGGELPTLALFAGKGALPRQIAVALAEAGRPYLVVTFPNTPLDWVAGHPHLAAAFERSGALFKALRARGVTSVCFAGGMTRPSLNPLKFDAHFLRLAPKLLPALKGGDDAALRAVNAIFEAEGFAITPAHHLLKGLMAGAGAFSAARPSAQAQADIARAAQILTTLSPLDIGQGCAVEAGLCLGIESIQGTDFLLETIARTPPHLRAAVGGVLVKMPKTGQDQRVDMPALGPQTLELAAQAGLSGIGFAAGEVMLLAQEEMRVRADALGLFLFGFERAERGDG